jgi:uncharacterized membrane protein
VRVRANRDAVREYLSGSLWVLPGIAIAGSLAAGSILTAIQIPESSPLYALMFQGTADDARQLLIVVSATMITVTGLVFSLTVVALQIASGQFSPRLLRNFVRDRPNQIVLSVFVATFAYSTAGLYTVGVNRGLRTESVPRLAVTGSLVLAFVSLAVLVWFLDHLAHSIQIDVILEVAERNLLKVISNLPDTRPEGRIPRAPDDAVGVKTWTAGYLQTVHPERLLPLATRAGATVVLLPRVGEHIVLGRTLAKVWPASAAPGLLEALEESVLIGPERTLQMDVGFGMRQLVDIALKALSPAVNDPYTGVMVVDRLTSALCALNGHDLGDDLRTDQDGELRVAMPRPRFEDYLNLCCDQIRRYGAGDPQVLRSLLRMLRRVAETTENPERRAAVARHARLVMETGERAIEHPEDLESLRRAFRRVPAGEAPTSVSVRERQLELRSEDGSEPGHLGL